MYGRRLVVAKPFEVDLTPTTASNWITPNQCIHHYGRYSAYIQIGYSTNLSGERHVETLVIHPNQRKDISFMARMGNWIRNFKIFSGIGMIIALIFRFRGLGTLLGAYIPCLRYCNLFNCLATPKQSANDVEAAGREIRQTGTPVTLVNVPHPVRQDPVSKNLVPNRGNIWKTNSAWEEDNLLYTLKPYDSYKPSAVKPLASHAVRPSFITSSFFIF